MLLVNAIHRVLCDRPAIHCPDRLNGFTAEHAESAEQLGLLVSAVLANFAVQSPRMYSRLVREAG